MKAAVLSALLACPAGPGSRTPRLAASPDALYLSWQEGSSVRVSRWDGEKWSKPSVAVDDKALFVNAADFPALAPLQGGGLALSWLPRSAPGASTYDVAVATSGDGGKTWGRPRSPHRDGTKSEHGFVSLVPGPGGRFTAVWLDGRGTAAKGPQALYAADWNGTSFEPEVELDAKVCDCCGTAAVSAGERLLVAYRDRTDAEVRDISLVAREKGRWSRPRALSSDAWSINGCPVNGPALAAKGSLVAAVWFTAAGDKPRVKFSFSKDGGRTFGAPTTLDSGEPSGRVDVVLLDDGAAVASWLEDGAAVARRITPGGEASAPFAIAPKASGFPRLAAWNGRVVAAWTDASGPKPRVRLSSFDPPGDLK